MVRRALCEVLEGPFESSRGTTALMSGFSVGPHAQQIPTLTSTADQMAISRLSSERFGFPNQQEYHIEI